MEHKQAQEQQRNRIEGKESTWADPNGRVWDTAEGQPILIGHDQEPERAEPVGQLTDPEAIWKFVLGGNAVFTLKSLKTEKRYTYKVRRVEDARGGVWFVDVLKGADNEGDFGYIGQIYEREHGNFPWYTRGKKCWPAYYGASEAFAWFSHKLFEVEVLPPTLEFWHTGRCGRCNRKLTVPESVASGFGPECIGKV